MEPIPKPLEEECPELAATILKIATGAHPNIQGVHITPFGTEIYKKNGSHELICVPSRNDPCPCGSGKKFKKCHAGYGHL